MGSRPVRIKAFITLTWLFTGTITLVPNLAISIRLAIIREEAPLVDIMLSTEPNFELKSVSIFFIVDWGWYKSSKFTNSVRS